MSWRSCKKETSVIFQDGGKINFIICHSPLPNLIDPSKSRQYKLQFESKLPSMVFTDNKQVEAEGPSPIRLLLRILIIQFVLVRFAYVIRIDIKYCIDNRK